MHKPRVDPAHSVTDNTGKKPRSTLLVTEEPPPSEDGGAQSLRPTTYQGV